MAGNPQKKSTGIVNAAIGALAVVLAILIVWMMNLVSGIQGTARIINYAGLVRGKTQRIVKLEISGQPQDGMIADIDALIDGLRFGSDKLKIAASVIIFIFLIPYTASLYNGLSRLFGMAFNIDYSVCVIVMAVLTGVYVIAGGYMATAINDFIQGIIMIVGICAVIAAVLNSQGGFMAALEGLAQVSDPAVSDIPGVFASFFGPDPLNLLGVVLLTSLGTWGLPQMVQKFYAIRDEKAIETGTVISSVFALLVAGGCYFLGGFGRLFSDQIDVAANGYDSIIPTMLSGLSDVLIAVVVILVLSASMSTLSSLVLASSSTLTLDFLKDHFIKDMDEKRQIRIIRGLIVVFIAISVVLAIIQYRSSVTFIAQLMGVSWGALAGAFLAPFLYGLYWKKATSAACWASWADWRHSSAGSHALFTGRLTLLMIFPAPLVSPATMLVPPMSSPIYISFISHTHLPGKMLIHSSGQLQRRVVAHLAVAVVHGRHLHDAGQVPARLHRDGQGGQLHPQDLGVGVLQAQAVIDCGVIPGLQLDDHIDLLIHLDGPHAEQAAYIDDPDAPQLHVVADQLRGGSHQGAMVGLLDLHRVVRDDAVAALDQLDGHLALAHAGLSLEEHPLAVDLHHHA